MSLQSIIESAWENRALLQEPTVQQAIEEVIAALDAGSLRVAAPQPNGDWGNV